MTASKGFVVPAGGGKYVGDNEPDRFSHLKLQLVRQAVPTAKLIENTVKPFKVTGQPLARSRH
jgi:hypothetical protein